ncbi:hypothetical protein MHYP_G00355640 [Metynnis hypsauchen]
MVVMSGRDQCEGGMFEDESDRDSAVGSAAGSELSDGGRGGEKEEPLRLYLPGEKSIDVSMNPWWSLISLPARLPL